MALDQACGPTRIWRPCRGARVASAEGAAHHTELPAESFDGAGCHRNALSAQLCVNLTDPVDPRPPVGMDFLDVLGEPGVPLPPCADGTVLEGVGGPLGRSSGP